jgi:hypothetical protein
MDHPRDSFEEDEVDLSSSDDASQDSAASTEPAAGGVDLDEARQEIRKQQELIATLQAQLVLAPPPQICFVFFFFCCSDLNSSVSPATVSTDREGLAW